MQGLKVKVATTVQLERGAPMRTHSASRVDPGCTRHRSRASATVVLLACTAMQRQHVNARTAGPAGLHLIKTRRYARGVALDGIKHMKASLSAWRVRLESTNQNEILRNASFVQSEHSMHLRTRHRVLYVRGGNTQGNMVGELLSLLFC